MRISRLIAPVLAFAALSFFSPALKAQPRIGSFGFGLSLGDPLALSFKGNLGGTNSWDAAIGKSWYGALHIHADYLWAANIFNSNKAGMYFGLGGVIGSGTGTGVFVSNRDGSWYSESGTRIGLHGVVGFNFMPFSAPVELFAELAPIVGLVGGSGFSYMPSFGVRYYP